MHWLLLFFQVADMRWLAFWSAFCLLLPTDGIISLKVLKSSLWTLPLRFVGPVAVSAKPVTRLCESTLLGYSTHIHVYCIGTEHYTEKLKMLETKLGAVDMK